MSPVVVARFPDVWEAELACSLLRSAGIDARLGEGDPGLSAVRGMIALRRGDRDRALSILSSAAERNPDDPQLLNALAFAYIARDHLAFAEQTLLRLCDLVPGNTPARRLLADVVLRQGRPGDASVHIEQVLAAGPASTEHLRFAGGVDMQTGQMPRATTRLKEVLARTPDDRTTLDLLMRCWELQDDRDDARATLETALAARPRNGALWDARLGVDGHDGEAAAAVRRARASEFPGFGEESSRYMVMEWCGLRGRGETGDRRGGQSAEKEA